MAGHVLEGWLAATATSAALLALVSGLQAGHEHLRRAGRSRRAVRQVAPRSVRHRGL